MSKFGVGVGEDFPVDEGRQEDPKDSCCYYRGSCGYGYRRDRPMFSFFAFWHRRWHRRNDPPPSQEPGK